MIFCKRDNGEFENKPLDWKGVYIRTDFHVNVTFAFGTLAPVHFVCANIVNSTN